MNKAALFILKILGTYLLLLFLLFSIGGDKAYRNFQLTFLESSLSEVGKDAKVYYKPLDDYAFVGLDIETGLVSQKMIKNAKKKIRASKKKQLQIEPVSLKISSIGIGYLPMLLFFSIGIWLVRSWKELLKFLLGTLLLFGFTSTVIYLMIMKKIQIVGKLRQYPIDSLQDNLISFFYKIFPARIDVMMVMALLIVIGLFGAKFKTLFKSI